MKVEKALAIFTDYSIVVYMEVEGIGDRIYIYYVPYTLFPSKENHQLFCVSDTTRKRTDPSATIFIILHIFLTVSFSCVPLVNIVNIPHYIWFSLSTTSSGLKGHHL